MEGCDSTTITTYLYIAPDTTELVANTCDPNQAGEQTMMLMNFRGCDSLIITATIYVPTIFDNPITTTCDPAQAGMVADTLQNQFGCDSLITTTTFNFIPPDTTIIATITCDSMLADTTMITTSNVHGCDSTIITRMTYVAPEYVQTFTPTCDLSAIDTIVTTLTNMEGCDSLIQSEIITYQGSPNTLVFATSCDPMQEGIVRNTYSNLAGCDSIVIIETSLLPTDMTFLQEVSCDPDSVGTDSIILTNIFGCDSIVITIMTAEALTVDFTETDATCADEADGSLLVNTVTGGMEPYLLAVDSGVYQALSLFPRLLAGTHILWIQDADGCTTKREFTIGAPPPLIVLIGNDTTINVGEMINIPVFLNQPVDTLFWNEASGISCEEVDCLRPVVQPFFNTLYTITVANRDGCTATDSMMVTINKDRPFYIPSVFSPNADGINDFFTLSPGSSTTRIISINIFNRWGALMYAAPPQLTEQLLPGWDGRFKGQPVANGVYVYVIEVEFVDGERKVFSGDVTVLR